MSTTIINPLTGQELTLGIPGVVGGWEFTNLSRSRLAIRGKPGTGKSTLLHSNPRALVLDPEGGGRTVPDPKAFRFPAVGVQVTAADYRNLVNELCKAKHPSIDTIGLDSLDAMIEVISKEYMAKFKVDSIGDIGQGKGYALVRGEIFGWLDKLHHAGYGLAVIAHDVVKTIRGKDGDILSQSIAVSDSFRSALMQRMEHVLQMVADTNTRIEGGKAISTPVRRLVSEVSGRWKGSQGEDFKTRLPLPTAIDLPLVGGWDILNTAWEEAITKRKTDNPSKS